MEEIHPGSVLGERYVLQEPTGQGGMATVWQATDRVLDRSVAVKVLHANLAEEPAFLERFRAEALASARLNHANVVNVFDTGGHGQTAYIVMELFDGETLREVISREGRLEPELSVRIILQVLEALQFAHDNGLVHRDVKPGNVLVGTDGRVKVTDFGIAKAAFDTGDPTTTGSVLGSAPYMSPEQVEGNPVDGRSDVYACGATLYEMLTGRPPFEGDTPLAAAMVRLTKDPIPPRAVRAGIPRALDAIVMRSLARDPDRRFSSAQDMAAALSRLDVPAEPAPLPAAVPAPGPRAGVFRSWMLIPLIAVLTAALAIAVGLLVGALQVGGPLGIEAKKTENPSASGGAVRPVSVTAFDPLGDGSENDDEAHLAADGDPQTFWQSENYRQLDFGGLKPGLGLLFNLGRRPATVTGFRLLTPFPGFRFQIRVGNDPTALENAAGPSFIARRSMRESTPEARGQFVLLWMTDVVPTATGNRDTVAEFKVFGSRG
jgi:eukaryotic-like serine/threonine-protein kinase